MPPVPQQDCGTSSGHAASGCPLDAWWGDAARLAQGLLQDSQDGLGENRTRTDASGRNPALAGVLSVRGLAGPRPAPATCLSAAGGRARDWTAPPAERQWA